MQNNQYTKIRQGPILNEIAQIGPFKLKGVSNIYTSSKQKVMFVDIDESDALRTSTFKLLDALVIEFTANSAQKVLLRIGDYMKKRGLKDRKELLKTLKKDVAVLLKMYVFREGDSIGSIAFDGKIFEDITIRRNVIEAVFANDFIAVLKRYYVMPYPSMLLSISEEGYYTLRKLAVQKYMNARDTYECTVSVKTLLKCKPPIPSTDAIQGGIDRHVHRRTLSRFERRLKLMGEVISYRYTLPGSKIEVTDPYVDEYESLNILTKWTDYPIPKKPKKAK